MAANWSDFTLVGSTTGNSAGTLSISNVQKNDLIIACSAVYTPYRRYSPAFSTHTPGGIETTEILNKNAVPQDGYWYWHPHYAWYYWYYWYYGYYWWWWYYRYWYYYPVIVSRISVYRADADGTVSITFSEPSGYGTIFSTLLRVWRPNITVGQYEEVQSIGFAESAQAPTSVGNVASIPVQQDELLLAMGVDAYYYDYRVGNFSVSGVNVQELVDFAPVYSNRVSRIKLWRIKQTGNATVTYSYCDAARMLMKIVPTVKLVQTTHPVPGENLIWVEIWADLLPSGRVERPRWFNSLRTEYAWNHSFGLRKRWIKEAAATTQGEKRARYVELWKVPQSAISSIPTGQAYIFTSEQEAEARVLYHDLGW